jgi:Rieske 2Fe-2S family protein
MSISDFALETLSLDKLAELLESHRAGWSLAGEFYKDKSIFKLEMKRIFARRWLFVGHVSQIQDYGDYFTYDIDGESIILTRAESGELRAFYNVCRHRGARLCTQSSGHSNRFVCSYHQWVYGLDGSLIASRFTGPDFDDSQFGLQAVAVRSVEGLIFICLAEDPPDCDEIDGDLHAHLKLHDLASAKISSTRRYTVHANWKLIDENARECYHCPGSHPEYCGAVISAAASTSATAQQRARNVQSAQELRWLDWGLETTGKPFRAGKHHSINRYALHPGAVTESLDGKPVAPLMGMLPDRDVGVVGIGIYPNLLAEACSDHAVTLRFTPLSPDLTEVEMQWLVRGDARSGIDFDVEKVEAVWRATAEQDWKLCELNQQGVNSRAYRPGLYTTLEWGCDHFDQWYVEQLRNS